MDEGKILIVNLSKGLIGEDNASLLGSFLVTKIQLAAMSRSDIDRIEDRRPFYLYVDEFQNFATDSFATILSEARKYGLNLTVANQYISQMSDTVRDAVFGNVGTIISFRISADDAPILAKQFEPQFESNDLLQTHNRNFVINMVIKGEKSPAFNASTLSLPPAQMDNTQEIVENTRRYYSRPRAEVEVEIAEAIRPPETLQKENATKNPRTFTPDKTEIKSIDNRQPFIMPEKLVKNYGDGVLHIANHDSIKQPETTVFKMKNLPPEEGSAKPKRRRPRRKKPTSNQNI